MTGDAPDPPRTIPASRASIAARTTSDGSAGDPAGVDADRDRLHGREFVYREPTVAHVPEAGVQAVDERLAVHEAIDHGP